MAKPDGWRRVEIEPGVEFAVPPGAERAEGTPVDSNAGYFEGDGYRITFDLGRFGEHLEDLEEEEHFVRSPRKLGGRTALEVGFVPSDEPFGWARVAQVDTGGGRTLTIRVSCDTRERSGVAEQVFDSVTLG